MAEAAAAKRDYYEVLGVAREADAKAIKDAFRRLAMQYHPDRNKEPGAEARFKEIAEAYAVLSDAKKRADYDAGGFAGVEGLRPEDLFGGIDFEDLFGAAGFDGGGLFERFFGGRGRTRHAGPPRGENIEMLLQVPLERVLHGGEERVRLERPQPCPACQGSGARAGTAPRPCPSCKGSGQAVKSRREGGVLYQQISPCAECHGVGRFIDEPCPDCHGSGHLEHGETLTVKVPVGVEDGMALRIPGHGMPAPQGGTPGDLFVVVRAQPDSRFQRHGADLWRLQELSLLDAVLGAELAVATLDGSAKVKVPPGTQPDTVLRLRGKGLPHFGHAGRGDLLLRLNVQVPAHLSTEERSLYEQLRRLREAAGRSTA